MLTATITNTSGATMAAGSLPGMLSWVGAITDSSSVSVVVGVADLMAEVSPHAGFSLGQELQKMIQAQTITVSYANLSTDTDNVSEAIGDEA